MNDDTISLERRPFKALGWDLFFDLRCSCRDPRFADSEIADLMPYTIKLSGYADDHFFDIVNAGPSYSTCRCGRKFRFQWFRDGVEACFLPAPRASRPINIVFDGPPGPEAGRFVEVETDDGASINAGEWIDRGDGLWALRITALPEGEKP